MKKKLLILWSIVIAIITFFASLFGIWSDGLNIKDRFATENIDIIGKWDTITAYKKVNELMEQYDKTDTFSVRDIMTLKPFKNKIHKVINSYWVDLVEKQSFFVVAYTGFELSDGEIGTCHSCPAPISIFEFQKIKEGYKIVNKYFDLTIYEGEYGNPPS